MLTSRASRAAVRLTDRLEKMIDGDAEAEDARQVYLLYLLSLLYLPQTEGDSEDGSLKIGCD